MNLVKTFALTVGLLSVTTAHAGQSAIKWQNFKNYEDVQSPYQSDDAYRNYITTNFEQHLAKLSKDLPNDFKLIVEITDLDLAGKVRYEGSKKVRLVNDIYMPEIKLNYTLIDGKGQIVNQNKDISLKNMNFINDKAGRSRDTMFFYEKRLMTKWFNKAVLSKIS